MEKESEKDTPFRTYYKTKPQKKPDSRRGSAPLKEIQGQKQRSNSLGGVNQILFTISCTTNAPSLENEVEYSALKSNAHHGGLS